MKHQGYSGWVLSACLLAGTLGGSAACAEGAKGTKMTVSTGKDVSLEYTLKLDDKSVLDSNVGKEPITYTHGRGQIIPGLEKALEGMSAGESKHVQVAPEDAYGPVNPAAFHEVKKDLIPEEGRKVGAQLEARGKDGQVRPVRVKEVKADTVVLDFNHPLAGKTLYFDVKVLDVKAGAAPNDKGTPKEKK